MSAQDSARPGADFVMGLPTDLSELVAMRENQRLALEQTRATLDQLTRTESALLEAHARFGRGVVELVGVRIRELGVPPLDLAERHRYFATVGDIAATVDRMSPDFRTAIDQAMSDVARMIIDEPIIFIGRAGRDVPAAGGVLRGVRAEAAGSRTRIGFVYSNGDESRYAMREVIELVTPCGSGDEAHFMPATGNILSGREAITDWLRDEWDKADTINQRCAIIASLRYTGMVLADCLPLAEADSFAEELAGLIEDIDAQAPTKALKERQSLYSGCLGLIKPSAE